MLSVTVVPRRGLVLRSVRASAEILLLVVAAHTWAGGALPSLPWMAATAGLVMLGSLLVLRGRVALRIAVPVLAAVQLVLHGWLAVLAAPASDAHVHAGHLHGPDAPLGLTVPMVLAHLLAAVVTAVVWELRGRATDVVLAWSEPGLVVPPVVRWRPASRPDVVTRAQRPVCVVPLRGPPVAVAAA